MVGACNELYDSYMMECLVNIKIEYEKHGCNDYSEMNALEFKTYVQEYFEKKRGAG